MVTSAVLGAATGTGLALVVAMTIVVYRYYAARRYAKDTWQSSWMPLPQHQLKQPKVAKRRRSNTPTNYTVAPNAVFNVSQEQRIVQPQRQTVPPPPCSSTASAECPMETTIGTGHFLTHQSRSYPSPRLDRVSVPTQSSLDSAISKQNQRGCMSAQQVRMFGTDPVAVAVTDPRRTPSPLPSSSPVPSPSASVDRTTPSPSQSSLVSVCSSHSSVSLRGHGLSPLLLPPRPSATDAPPASPLGTLQPDLYQPRVEPLFLKSANHSGPSLGRLHLRLDYDFDRSDLHVHLIEAHDLAGSEEGGFNDPYVKLSLSPEVDTRKRQTNIHRSNPDPYFDQRFKFPVSHEDLQDKTLVLQVFDYDRFSRNNVVGEVRINFCELNVTNSLEIWSDITKHKKPPEETQEILLSLSYLPSAERLTVVLLKARNLFMPQNKDTIDPYVKVYLVVGGKRVKKKKTAARKNCINPVWNEALVFNVPSSNIPNSGVEVCLMDQSDAMSNKDPLGSCVIGASTIAEQGPPQDHWIDMQQSPRKAVAMWHALQ